MLEPIRIGIAGLGTVGTGVLKIIARHEALLSRRVGRGIEVKAVCARDRNRERDVEISKFEWVDSPRDLAMRPDIDVFIELMGGDGDPAKSSVEAAIASGKDVVTANKALLALHGQELAEAAERNGRVLRFEAAVAGGIPVIKALTESMAANQITSVMGIMNGTCNYILTRMENAGLGYEEVFEEASNLGYLEADPNLDVGGIDAAHKLALLASVAYGSRVDFGNIRIEGITRISIGDIEQARDMGFRIKLLGIARKSDQGLEQRMQPCLVPMDSPLGQVENATNIVVLEGDQAGPIFLRGAGAGQGPTASAVLSDVMDIARGQRISTFGQPAKSLVRLKPYHGETPAAFYLRLLLKDQPGVLATVAGALGNSGVSINRMRQYGHDDEAAPVIIVTHQTTRSKLDRALSEIQRSRAVLCDPVSIRIQEV